MMTLSTDTLDELTVASCATDLRRLREVFRDPGTGALGVFGPEFEIVDAAAALTWSETRLLNVFKRLDSQAGQSVAVSLLWVNWRMFGDEVAIWDALERLKQRRLVIAGEGRGGLCLTDAGFAILSSL